MPPFLQGGIFGDRNVLGIERKPFKFLSIDQKAARKTLQRQAKSFRQLSVTRT
jgi:hypothetical protein